MERLGIQQPSPRSVKPYLVALDKRHGCTCKDCLKAKDCKAKPVVNCPWKKEGE